MARTPAQKAALEKKALASENKSDGMRQLLDAGYSVSEVRTLFGAPYGFVYGVATRNGNVTPTTREAKPKAEKASAKAPARPKATAAKVTRPARSAKTPAKTKAARAKA